MPNDDYPDRKIDFDGYLDPPDDPEPEANIQVWRDPNCEYAVHFADASGSYWFTLWQDGFIEMFGWELYKQIFTNNAITATPRFARLDFTLL